MWQRGNFHQRNDRAKENSQFVTTAKKIFDTRDLLEKHQQELHSVPPMSATESETEELPLEHHEEPAHHHEEQVQLQGNPKIMKTEKMF